MKFQSVSLYIDTTYALNFGILDENFKWIDYSLSLDLKESPTFHKKIHAALLAHNIKIADIKKYFIVSGPGSYTGIRLSESLSQMFSFGEGEIYSFYHFEVPHLLGKKAGTWLGNAFKGEWFAYIWSSKIEGRMKLFLEKDLQEELLGSEEAVELFAHDAKHAGLVDKSFLKERVIHGTIEMIKQESERVFSILEDRKSTRPPYYYRPAEVEFKVKKS